MIRASKSKMFVALAAIFTIAHIYFFAATWPNITFLGEMLSTLDVEYHLARLAFGCAIGISLACLNKLLKKQRILAMVIVLLFWVLIVTALSALPIGKVYLVSFDITVIAGVLLGCLIGVSRPETVVPRDCLLLSHSIAWLIFYAFAMNFFLLLAPYSQIVPSGIQEPGRLSMLSLNLHDKDSVGIKSNLIFLGVQHLISLVVGHSILSSSLTSMALCAFGIASFATGTRILLGNLLSCLALVFMVSDSWVLTAAYAGNLTVTLLTSAGVSFLLLAYVLGDQSDRISLPKIAFGVLVVTFLGLYSYAAVRMPCVLSLLVIFGAVGWRVLRKDGVAKMLFGIASLVTPILILVVVVLMVGYSGAVRVFSTDLLVSWPSTSVIGHPKEADLANYSLIHNPDVPIWQQVGRPTTGENVSYIWTRNFSEISDALRSHLVLISQEHPKFFFLRPATFFLILSVFASFPVMNAVVQRAVIALSAWAVIWILSFLLVPDVVAYRRGLAFSPISAALASLAFAGSGKVRGAFRFLPVALGVLLCICRLPEQLRFSNEPETRSRMFTVCGTSYAVRSLLTSPKISDLAEASMSVSTAGLENGREIGCVANAVKTREWRTLLPHSSINEAENFDLLVQQVATTSRMTAVVYCSDSSNRLPSLGRVCRNEEPKVRTIQMIPVKYGGVSNSWVVFTGR